MSADSLSALFQPFEHDGLTLKNRIVMSPMTRYFSPGGSPGEGVAAYYEKRALGGAGLLISEGTFIDRPQARNVDSAPSFHGEALEAWREVVDRVHAAGGKMAPQLWHTGAAPDYNYPEQADRYALEGPSGLKAPGHPCGTSMSDADIADAIRSFAQGCADAHAAGFDAIAFHGAHGYLFDQFFWAGTNRREDDWGGETLAERSRFAIEAIRAGREAAGGLPIMFRISQWKITDYAAKMAFTPADLEEWLVPLAEAGVDIFDCSQRRFWEPEFEGSDLNLAGWVKKVTGKPTMTVGSVGLATDLMTDFESRAVSQPVPKTILDVAERLERGEFDLVAVGRAMLADADWARKVQKRRFGELTGYSVDLMKTLA